MRLHRLEVQAFQAFAGRETVDFDALTEAGLFLLHGETGAGKTTLLDAVVFALYGELPGARGRDARVRSDHAAPDRRTEVVLEATLRGERVRIVRTPKQERPKQRGEGFVEDAATVLMEAVEADGTTRVLATRREEAGHELERLLGMSREQFCQVVLLPQGEFATFLRAESDAREALLERIFSAGRFRGAEHWLSERRKEAAASLETSVRSLRDVVSAVAEAADVIPPETWESEPAVLTPWLDEAHVVAEAELATATANEAATVAEREATAAAASEGAALARRRTRHAEAVAAIGAHEARRPERDRWAAELERARAAVAVEPLLAVLDEQNAAVRAARDAITAAGVSAGEDATSLRARADAALRRAGEVAALRETEDGLALRRAELAGLRRELAVEGVAADAARHALAGAATARLALVTAVERAQHAAATVVAAERDAAAVAARHDAARRRDDARARVEALTTARQTAVESEQSARERWLDLRERRLAGMAAELAANLADGEPCAVCGSTEHPAPTQPAGGALVSAADERAAQTAHDGARSARETVDRDLDEARGALAAAAATAGDDTIAALREQAALAGRNAATLAADAAQAPAAVAALDGHDAAIEAQTRALAGAEQSVARLEASIAGRDEAIASDAAALVAALDGVAGVAERLAGLERAAALAERGAAALDALAGAELEAVRGTERAAEAARTAGFVDVVAAREAARPADARTALAARVEGFDEELTRCRTAAADPELLAAVAAEAPDVPALAAAAGIAADAAKAATGAVAVVRRRAERLDAQRTTLAERLTAFGPAAERAARVRSLAHLVDGSSPQNRKRMRLSAYVLAARLEEIAAAASVRLGGMSGGRYVLEHRDEGADGRRRAGLGLVVVDAWTGRERSPRTLSGGETFLASLALALGLADVVAAESGGARLETLFVDEGFGSLDEQTLDEVLDVLDRLREGGRAVGVVSHVGELRDRVTTRLFVEKGRTGSHVRQTRPVP